MAEVLEDEERSEAVPDQATVSVESLPENWDDWDQPERQRPADMPTFHLDGFDGPMVLIFTEN